MSDFGSQSDSLFADVLPTPEGGWPQAADPSTIWDRTYPNWRAGLPLPVDPSAEPMPTDHVWSAGRDVPIATAGDFYHVAGLGASTDANSNSNAPTIGAATSHQATPVAFTGSGHAGDSEATASAGGSIAGQPFPWTDPGVAARAKVANESGGGMESLIRNAANGATFNLADTIAAAGDATIPLDPGSSTAPTWAQRYQENKGQQYLRSLADLREHPIMSRVGEVAGVVANPIQKVLPVPEWWPEAAANGYIKGFLSGVGHAIRYREDGQSGTDDVRDASSAGAAFGAFRQVLKGGL